ncbi:MAG: prepilin-type N-terminal cleavage/methylation domain-containing protein [Deltaproteobacteria bacterium]|nr:prepilin-type N-terminal cleavage/methylation domain-containing protein [Deltaproteobacteria bacterium]MCL5891706.1 prepilin-type N-terminal cleavage/methylation domain-containing protein [Deltaproteobacteria bacterium]
MFKHIKKAKDTGGFSLLEIVITIIIIGLALSAIAESFIVGSAKSVNIVNEETAVNVAKQEMAALNYCRNGGSVNGVCSAFNNTGSPNCKGKGKPNTWDCPSSFYTTPQGPTPINNECFYTTVTAKNVDSDFIQTIVKTGWFALNSVGTCPGPPASYPYVTISTIFANY